MKKKIVWGLLLPVVSIILSCQKETEVPQTGTQPESIAGELLEITAAWAEDKEGTRTVLQDNGTSIWWTPGDAINVFYSNTASGKFTSTLTEPKATATFQGTLNANIGLQGSASFWAVYPYDEANTCDGQSVTITVPAGQNAVAGSFADKFFPAVATGKSTQLAFWNVCGGARFSVTKKHIERVTFTSADGSPLCGNVKIDFGSDGKPRIASVVEGQPSLTVLAPEGGFVPGAYYYAAMLPQKHEQGIAVELRRNVSTAEIALSGSITVRRSVFGNLDGIDSGVTYKPSDDPIVFADTRVKADCVAAFDTNGDGELSYAEAATVTSLEGKLTSKLYTSFDELIYFTSVTEIPETWFKNRVRLRSIRLPENLESIGTEAFSGCGALTALELPESLRQIGASAFAGCTSLKDITVDNFNSWASIAYADAAAVPFNAATEGGHLYAAGAEITAATVPAANPLLCFHNWAGLQEISIPASVTSFSEDTFKGCTGLKKAVLSNAAKWLEMRYANAAAAPFYASGNGHLFVNGAELTEYTIPEELEEIAAWAFCNCTGLTDIVLEPVFPPVLGEGALDGVTAAIHVWRECLDLYASAWSGYASLLVPMD